MVAAARFGPATAYLLTHPCDTRQARLQRICCLAPFELVGNLSEMAPAARRASDFSAVSPSLGVLEQRVPMNPAVFPSFRSSGAWSAIPA